MADSQVQSSPAWVSLLRGTETPSRFSRNLKSRIHEFLTRRWWNTHLRWRSFYGLRGTFHRTKAMNHRTKAMKTRTQATDSNEHFGQENHAPALPVVALLLPALLAGIWMLVR